LLIIDVQNDFITGSLALIDCPAKQQGAEVIPIINHLIDTVPFDVISYSQDWHPPDHSSFIENVYKRPLEKYSPVTNKTKQKSVNKLNDLKFNQAI
jgi:nicotinamidase-related amidase